jgi:hypothetical protein
MGVGEMGHWSIGEMERWGKESTELDSLSALRIAA